MEVPKTPVSSQVLRIKTSETSLNAYHAAVGSPATDTLPTFLTVCRGGEFEILQKIGVPLASVLHAEQEYEIFSKIPKGSELQFQTILTKAFDKRGMGGKLTFLIFETKIEAGPNIIATASTTMVVREKKAASV